MMLVEKGRESRLDATEDERRRRREGGKAKASEERAGSFARSLARFAQQMAAPLAAQMERKRGRARARRKGWTDGPQIKLCSLCGHRGRTRKK